MGVKGLWKILSPAGQSTTLQRLTIQEGFVKNVGGGKAYRIGIDASGWIYAACSRHSSTKSPELAILFSRCVRLLELPTIPVFIFDGPRRPKNKRRRLIRGNNHWSMVDFKKMLDALGFSVIDAPAEAEAELAWQNQSGLLDAVITEDSDAFVFGATTVIRLSANFSSTGAVTVYHAARIAELLGYDKPALVLMALLAGGDYSTGIPGCGIKLAQHISKSGLGTRLLMEPETEEGRGNFCNALRTEFIQTNTTPLQARCHRLVDAIPHIFPDPTVFNSYVHPATTELVPAGIRLPSRRTPNLVALAIFAEENFVWGNCIGILNRFSKQVFPGMAMYELIQSAAAANAGLHQPSCPSISGIIGCRKNCPEGERDPEMRVTLSLDSHVINICRALKGTCSTSSMQASIEQFKAKVHRAWLPTAMLQAVFPDMVKTAEGSQVHKTLMPNIEIIDLTSPSPPLSQSSLGPRHLDFIDLTSSNSI